MTADEEGLNPVSPQPPTLENAVQGFLDKHQPTVHQQFHCLIEEVGELSEALLTDDNVKEEIEDVCFVALTLLYQHGYNLHHVQSTALENVNKTTSTKGNKITKEQEDTTNE